MNYSFFRYVRNTFTNQRLANLIGKYVDWSYEDQPNSLDKQQYYFSRWVKGTVSNSDRLFCLRDGENLENIFQK